jgi:ATP-dependent Clp protease ATP-binding subunit ClpX
MPLDRAAMVQILTEPKNAVVRQYQHLFSLEDARLEFTDEALNAIADVAMKRETGARALRAVLDEFMLEMMYELPDYDSAGVTFTVDAEDIVAGTSLANLRQQKVKESA